MFSRNSFKYGVTRCNFREKYNFIHRIMKDQTMKLDWGIFSGSSQITWEIVRENPNCAWNWNLLSKNPKVATPDIIRKNPNLPWKRRFFASNPSMTIEFVLEIFYSGIGFERIPGGWDWKALSDNPSVATWENVCKYPDLPWAYDILSGNRSITWEIIQANPYPNGYSWCMSGISANPNITSEIIRENHDKYDWDWEELTTNPSMNMEFILETCNNSEYADLGSVPAGNLPWELDDMCSMEWYIGIEYILNNPDKIRNWFGLSRNPNITWEFVRENIDKPWNTEQLFMNSAMTWENIQEFCRLKKYDDKTKINKSVVCNPNIPYRVIRQFTDGKSSDDSVWYFLCNNDFTDNPVVSQRLVNNRNFRKYIVENREDVNVFSGKHKSLPKFRTRVWNV